MSKHINFEVEDDLHQAAKLKAVQEKMTVADFLRGCLRWWTGMEPDPGQPAAVGDGAKAGPRP